MYIYIYTTGKNGVWSHSVNFEYAGANVHFMLNKDEIFDEYIASLNDDVYSKQQKKEIIVLSFCCNVYGYYCVVRVSEMML